MEVCISSDFDSLCRFADMVVRSHEVKTEGYEIDHNGKLVTVFSAPNYCDQVCSLRFQSWCYGRAGDSVVAVVRALRWATRVRSLDLIPR